MRRSAALAAVATVVLMLVVSGLLAAQAKARAKSVDGHDIGEVLVNGNVVIRLRTEQGGQTAVERAGAVADRLNDAFDRKVTWRDFSVVNFDGEAAVKAKDTVIVTVDRLEVEAAGADSAVQLAGQWHDNIVRALGGKVAQGEWTDWSITDKKIVPVLGVNLNGARVGAAQVGGPKEQVDKVKAVAQLDADYHEQVRAKVYIPIDSLNVIRLGRVQGVSVIALVDVRVLGR